MHYLHLFKARLLQYYGDGVEYSKPDSCSSYECKGKKRCKKWLEGGSRKSSKLRKKSFCVSKMCVWLVFKILKFLLS